MHEEQAAEYVKPSRCIGYVANYVFRATGEQQDNADPSQTDQNAGSRAQGVRQGAEPSVGNPADDSLDPHRSLGDAIKVHGSCGTRAFS